MRYKSGSCDSAAKTFGLERKSKGISDGQGCVVYLDNNLMMMSFIFILL